MFQLRLPERVSAVLSLVLGLLGGGELGLDPLAALLLEPQPLPRRLAFGVKRDHPAKMDRGLLLQSVLVAPEGKPPLIIGLVGSASAAVQVLFEDRLPRRVVTGLAADIIGPLPFAMVKDEPQQAAGRRVLGIAERGQSELLDPFGRQSVGFTPEGELDVRVGIAAQLGRGLLIGRQVRLCRLAFALHRSVGTQQGTTEQER